MLLVLCAAATIAAGTIATSTRSRANGFGRRGYRRLARILQDATF